MLFGKYRYDGCICTHKDGYEHNMSAIQDHCDLCGEVFWVDELIYPRIGEPGICEGCRSENERKSDYRSR